MRVQRERSYNTNNVTIYCAVIMATPLREHSVHSVNADWMPSGYQPSDQANQLGLWVHL